MIDALIDGERRGPVLADLAKGRMRTAGKIADLSMALAGFFTEHHALLCLLHRDRITRCSMTRSPGWTGRSRRRPGAGSPELDLLKTIPGFGDVIAQAWLGEMGPAPHRHFASHEKLACWVSLCPGNNISARKRKHGRTGDAGAYIKPMLIQAAWNAIRTKGRLQARYSRLVRRFGGEKNPAAKKKAITAIAHTLLKIAYQVLKSGQPYQDRARTSTPGGNHPPSSTPTWNGGSRSSTPARPSPSPSARRPAVPRRPPERPPPLLPRPRRSGAAPTPAPGPPPDNPAPPP